MVNLIDNEIKNARKAAVRLAGSAGPRLAMEYAFQDFKEHFPCSECLPEAEMCLSKLPIGYTVIPMSKESSRAAMYPRWELVLCIEGYDLFGKYSEACDYYDKHQKHNINYI